MAPQQPPQHPLDVPPAMVNGVLFQTAKVFRDSLKQGPSTVSYNNNQMKSIISGLQVRMHSALDELEVEILRAKATIERDLTEARDQRTEREKAAAAEKRRLAGESEPKESPAQITNGETKPQNDETANEDVVMTNGEDKPADKEGTVGDISKKESPKPAVSAPAAPEASQTSTTKTKPDQAPEKPSQETPSGLLNAMNTSQPPQQPPSATPATASSMNLDIDQMFTDAQNDNAATTNAISDPNADFTFDLDDFTNDPNITDLTSTGDAAFSNQQDNAGPSSNNLPDDLDLDLFGDSTGNVDLSGGGAGGDGTGEGDANEEMLPGLRSYANAPEEGDDFLNNTNDSQTLPNIATGQSQSQAQQPGQQDDNNDGGLFDPNDNSIPAELLPDATSSFDDLFDASGGAFDLEGDGGLSAGGVGGGNGGGGGNGDGTLGMGNEFDDWMNFS
ncbi:MAG: hypothetical protein M4579_002899 [Chaenotheca gracillima]|nr:MAG: hypothetical protein M4579_002899 [Chaenotheca gracillima]